ncbi:MAG: hypothetical protein V2A69_02460 [Pseudomonadota bacterium]
MVGLVLLASSWSMASSASLYYSDGPWKGKIIDAETKEPIEGAVVLAVWQKIYASPTGNHSYFFDAIETLTNREGRFFIKEFEAINILPVLRRLDGPWFTIFKPGYTPFGANYDYFHKYFPNSPLKVDRHTLTELFKKGVTVELLRLKTREERLMSLSRADPLGAVPDDKMPTLMDLINLERKELGLDPIPLKGGK